MFAVLVTVVLSVSIAVPAEDVPETAYDESESMPYEGSPEVSVAEPEAAKLALAARPPISQRHSSSPWIKDAPVVLIRVTGSVDRLADSITIFERSLRC